MSYSNLATKVNLTQNCNPRTHKITKITPHYMAAYWSGDRCAQSFLPRSRGASANYCIGVDGDIVVSVDENDRAWTSSSEWNDQRAITIECGNNPDGSLPDPCYKALVNLCADICRRYGIDPHYDGTTSGSITMHKQFAATSCPGPWLTEKIVSGQLEKDIKAAMNPRSGWIQYGAKWKYIWPNGEEAAPGWHKIDGKDYYFHNSGFMATGRIQRGNRVFTFDKSGACTGSEKAAGKISWNRSAEVEAGDIIAAFNLAISDADSKTCHIPALGKVPMDKIYENRTKSKDGNPTDNHLANTAAVVNTTEWEVTKVDVKNNLLQCNGQWWPAGPFSRKEYK